MKMLSPAGRTLTRAGCTAHENARLPQPEQPGEPGRARAAYCTTQLMTSENSWSSGSPPTERNLTNTSVLRG